MERSIDQNTWVKDIPPVCLRLKSDIVRRICRFLPTQQDQFNACFISRRWSPSAIDVLWEDPKFSFRQPRKFSSFLTVVKASCESNQSFLREPLALRVRRLNLVFEDDRSPIEFVPVLRSEREEHRRKKDTIMADPRVLVKLARYCERVEELEVYGFKLTDQDISSITNDCLKLTKLRIIGATHLSQNLLYSLSKIFSSIQVLHLDGYTHVTDHFIDVLSNKCRKLTSLKLSVSQVGVNGLWTLADCPKTLEELCLVDCRQLSESNIRKFTEAFPKLKSLTLTGCSLTSLSLKYIITNCKRLLHLELRCAHPETEDDIQEPNKTATEWLNIIGSHVARPLTDLLLENISLTDGVINAISIICNDIRVLGFSHCPILSDYAIANLVSHNRGLETANILHCSGVSGISIMALAKNNTNTLKSVVISHISKINPYFVHQLVQATRGTLQRIIINGSPDIVSSFIFDYSDEYMLPSPEGEQAKQEYRCSLSQIGIQKLAASKVEEPSMPKQYTLGTLSELQVTLLAAELGLSYLDVDAALRKILAINESPSRLQSPTKSATAFSPVRGYPQRLHNESESLKTVETRQSSSRTSSISSLQSRSSQDHSFDMQNLTSKSISPLQEAMHEYSDISIVAQSPHLSTGNSSATTARPQRSSKLADYNLVDEIDRKLDLNGYVRIPETDVRRRSPSVDDDEVGGVDENNDDGEIESYDNDDDADDEDGESPSLSTLNPRINQSRSSPPANDLGGWGTPSTSLESWAVNPIPTGGTSKKDSRLWDANVGDMMNWKPETVTLTTTEGKKKGTIKPNFDLDDSEGWGGPPNLKVPWDDERRQGFNFEILHKQVSTTYWKKDHGEWQKLTTEPQYPDLSSSDTDQLPEQSSKKVQDTGKQDGTNGAQRNAESRNVLSLRRQKSDSPSSPERPNLEGGKNDSIAGGLNRSVSHSAAPVDRPRPGNPKWKAFDQWVKDEEPKNKFDYRDFQNPLGTYSNRAAEENIEPSDHDEWNTPRSLGAAEDLNFSYNPGDWAADDPMTSPLISQQPQEQVSMSFDDWVTASSKKSLNSKKPIQPVAAKNSTNADTPINILSNFQNIDQDFMDQFVRKPHSEEHKRENPNKKAERDVSSVIGLKNEQTSRKITESQRQYTTADDSDDEWFIGGAKQPLPRSDTTSQDYNNQFKRYPQYVSKAAVAKDRQPIPPKQMAGQWGSFQPDDPAHKPSYQPPRPHAEPELLQFHHPDNPSDNDSTIVRPHDNEVKHSEQTQSNGVSSPSHSQSRILDSRSHSLLDDVDLFTMTAQPDTLLKSPSSPSSLPILPVVSQPATTDDNNAQETMSQQNPPSRKPIVELNIETQQFGHKSLHIWENDDIDAKTSEFCDKWQMQSYKANLIKMAKEKYAKKLAKRTEKLRKKSSTKDSGDNENVMSLI